MNLCGLGSVARVAAVSAAEDHLADPEGSDELDVAGDGLIGAQILVVTDKLGGSVAQG